jgi:hypothetical protein
MTVESTNRRRQYDTNGTTGPWTVPFYFLANADLEVIHTDAAGVETTLTLTTHYSVTGAGVPAGGAVTTVASYASGGTITVLRSVAILQETDYVETDAFPAAAHETALDRLTMIAQQQGEALDRTLTFPASDEISGTLPPAATRANKLLAFDAAGAPEESPFTVTQVSSAIAAAYSGMGTADAATFIAAGVGAKPRTVQDREREFVWVTDYDGCDPTGATFSTAAINSAMATGKLVRLPYGHFKYSGNLNLTEGGLIGEGFGIGGAGAQFTLLEFFNQTDTTKGAIYTRTATQKSNFPRLENLYIQASSWHGVTGCLGYGLDIEAPLICERVVVSGFKKSGVFLHQNAAGSGGPYGSLLRNVRALTNGQHGILVGSGANAFSIESCDGKWNGAPSFGVAPTVAGSYDGLHIENTADGGGYAAFIPTSIVISGGDFSYNSAYGINIVDCNGGDMGGAYAEGNLSASLKQHRTGAGCNRGRYDFGLAIAGAGGLVDIDTVDTALAQTAEILCNGYRYGGASNVAQTLAYDKSLSTSDGRTRQLYFGSDSVGATNSTVMQAHTDGNAYYYGNGTGRHIFSNGLKVGNIAQSDVAVLDWYEEGTFVPAIVGTSLAGVGTYSPTPTGTYTRIGNRVFFDIDITWSGHTGTGNMTITALPFSAVGVAVTSLTYTNLAVGAGKTMGAQIVGTTLTLYSQDPAGGAVAAVAMDTAAAIVLSGVYRV